MVPHRLGDLRAEPGGQEVRTALFVAEIDAPAGRSPVGEVEEVADVVQERCGHQYVRGAVALRECCALERVVGLAHHLVVGLVAPRFVQRHQRVDARHSTNSPSKSPISDTRLASVPAAASSSRLRR